MAQLVQVYLRFKFLARRRAKKTDVESDSDENMENDLMDSGAKEAEIQSIQFHEPQRVLPSAPQSSILSASAHASELRKSQQKIAYIPHLTYKSRWKMKYDWVYCDEPKEGMFVEYVRKVGTLMLLPEEHG